MPEGNDKLSPLLIMMTLQTKIRGSFKLMKVDAYQQAAATPKSPLVQVFNGGNFTARVTDSIS